MDTVCLGNFVYPQGSSRWSGKGSQVCLQPSISLLVCAVMAPYSLVTGHAVPFPAESWALDTVWTPTAGYHCLNSASALP